MKKKLIRLLSITILLAIFTATGQVFGPKKTVRADISPTSPHYPSVKTTYWITGDQTTLDYVAGHYDWVDGATQPIANWIAKNPTGKHDLYYHWHILNLIDDGNGSTHAKQAHDWYKYAITNNVDWEDGYYHLGEGDTEIYIDRSAVTTGYVYGHYMDSQIRYIFRNSSSDNKDRKLWEGTEDQSLAANNDMLSFGRLDKFDELNIEYAATPPSGWKGVLEYSTGQGTWATLTPTSDVTSGLVRTVKFAPPSGWKRTKVNAEPTLWGNDGVYFVRLKNNSTSGPKIRKAQGRHYWVHKYAGGVNNDTCGTAANYCSNKVPAWDSRNDDNNDGYISDSERTSLTNSVATAHFRYEARLPHKWAWSQFALNLSNSRTRQVIVDHTLNHLNNNSPSAINRYVGARLDDMDGDPNIPPVARDKVVEYPDSTSESTVDKWRDDYELMLILGKDTLHNGNYLIGGNVSSNGIDKFSQHFDFHMREDGAPGSGGAAKSAAPDFNGSWETFQWPATSQWQKWSDAGKPMLWQWQLSLYVKMGDSGKSVKITNGSRTVIGVNTNWSSTLQPGSYISVSNTDVNGQNKTDHYAEVESIQSNTQLTLKENWPWASATSIGHFGYPARDKYLGLAAFMAIQNPDHDYFSEWFSFTYHGTRAPYLNWVPAVQNDYGQPTENLYGKEPRGTRGAFLLQTGTDPTAPKSTGGYHNYMVYGRDYDKALVVFRPTTKYDADYSDNSKTDVTLPAGDTYHLVKYDGSITPTPIANNKISLRNAEGAILMKGSALGITLDKSANVTSLSANQEAEYTIVYENINPSKTFSNVKIEDNVPNGTLYVAGSARTKSSTGTITAKTDGCSDADGYCYSGGSCVSGYCTGGKATWNLGNLSSGATGEVIFKIKAQ